jgi:Uma2 family endonuclease
LDTTTKRREYAKAGIPEYWVADPMHKAHTVLTLQSANSQYTMQASSQPGDRAKSALLKGFEVEMNCIFTQNLLMRSLEKYTE